MKKIVIDLLRRNAYPLIISKKLVMLILDNKLIVMTLKHGIQEFKYTDSFKALPIIAQEEVYDFGCASICRVIDACNEFKQHENFIYNVGFLITALDELDWNMINFFFSCAGNDNMSGEVEGFVKMAKGCNLNTDLYEVFM